MKNAILVSTILVQVAVVVEGFVWLGLTPGAARHDVIGGGCSNSMAASSRSDQSSGSHRACARAPKVRVQAGWLRAGGVGGGVVCGGAGGHGVRLQAETSSSPSAAAAATAASAPRRRRPTAEGAVAINGKQGELRKLQDNLKRELEGNTSINMIGSINMIV